MFLARNNKLAVIVLVALILSHSPHDTMLIHCLLYFSSISKFAKHVIAFSALFVPLTAEEPQQLHTLETQEDHDTDPKGKGSITKKRECGVIEFGLGNEEVALQNLSSGTMSFKLSYQASVHPTSYSQNVNLYQPGLSNGRQSSISVSENKIMNIPTLASVFNPTSSALEKAHTSLLSPPLSFLGGLVGRIETTLHGSAHDIGWLQCTHPTNPIRDGTNRFMELLAVTRNGAHILPDKFVYFLVPGLFSNHFPFCFIDTKNLLSRLGLTCYIAQIHSEASVKTNAQELTKQIENLYLYHGKKVLVLGHSKGGVDAAAAMAMHWTNLKDKVAGLALVQSPYGGTPIASDIIGEGESAENVKWIILELLMCKFIKE